MRGALSVTDWPVLRFVPKRTEAGELARDVVEERMDISAFVAPSSALPELAGLKDHGEDGWTKDAIGGRS